MKFIDVETVRLFVNGVAPSLELAQYHAKTNNQHGVEVEIHNAMIELQVLPEELDKTEHPRNTDIVEP